MNNFSTPQRTQLCPTCPFARTTTKEYLDTRGDNGERFLAQANMNAVLPCHCEDHGSATVGVCQQCAGAAKFRANVGVTGLSESLGSLPPDTENVFASNAELLAHHKGISLEAATALLQGEALERMKEREWQLAFQKNRVELTPTEVSLNEVLAERKQNKEYRYIVFVYEQQLDGNWQTVKQLTLPLQRKDNLVFCGGNMLPGYNFDGLAVRGLTDRELLDELAAEQAFVFINETDIVEHTISEDDSSSDPAWMRGRRVSWRLV